MTRNALLAGLTLLGLALTTPALAQSKRWIRNPQISPDGSQVAFCYQGDIWLVSSQGGQARLLTRHTDNEVDPTWSPDSQSLAFASNRHGNWDVFIISVNGGPSKRLTCHSSNDQPWAFSRDGQQLYFSSTRLDTAQSMLPSTRMSELYAVSVAGGRPQMLSTTPMQELSLSPKDGRWAYQDIKGYENAFRKHHSSSVARDIWLYDSTTGKHKKLSDFAGEDRDPVWHPSAQSLYYLSEVSGSFNVVQHQLDSGKITAITQHKDHPVRSLSIDKSGRLVYNFNGEIWIKAPKGPAQALNIQIQSSETQNKIEWQTHTKGATTMAVSPNEEEIAFIVRGDVFVVSVEHGTTQHVTSTPEQERSLTWAPDGRSLYYAAERPSSWNIYRAVLADKDEQRFYKATLIREESVLVSDSETFQPSLSPDGLKLAYLHERDSLRVLDLKTNKSREVVPSKNLYSYSDGDIAFSWSPDSQWLAFSYIAHKRWVEEVGLAAIHDSKIINITRSGYWETAPKWAANGKALVFLSEEFGRRSHGSWGSDMDLLLCYLNKDAYNEARLSKADWKDLQKRRKKDKDKTKGKDKNKGEAKDKAIEPLKIDIEGLHKRIRRGSLHSAPMGDCALSLDGEVLIYFAQEERRWDLWMTHLRERATRKILDLGDPREGQMTLSKDGRTLFLRRASGQLGKVKLDGVLKAKGGPATLKGIRYSARQGIDRAAERRHMFQHVWRQASRKFYDPKLHGVDWPAIRKNYQAFLGSINNNLDFSELLSEMLGELNASHTGSGFRLRKQHSDQTAQLGMLFDTDHTGRGLKIAEVLKHGPADIDSAQISAGDILTHIQGELLLPTVNPWRLLNHRVGRPTRLSFLKPKTGKIWDQVIKPISSRDQDRLLYERWIERCRALTKKLSGGKIGYVHVRSMNERSFRRVYKEVLGLNSEKLALIVDTRFNGGGWLHNDLVQFLSGKPYFDFVPRGKTRGQLGSEPFNQWTRPVVVIQSEGNYSDAHVFPYAFRTLKLGKLIGAPVPGTGTAVWWETLMDPSLYFGIPQVGLVQPNGQYLENSQLQPDILVLNDPESLAKGEDKQLAASVNELLKQLSKKK